MALKELLTHLIMGDPVPRSQASKAEPPPPPDNVTNHQKQQVNSNKISSNNNNSKMAQPMHLGHQLNHNHSQNHNSHHNHNHQQQQHQLKQQQQQQQHHDWQLDCKYTLSEVQQHCSLDDCWVVIFDKVYNITEFVFEHPGGDFILLEYAGRDATHPFLSSRHGSSAYKMLDKYWIGILVDEELYYSNNSSYCSVYSNLSWRTTPPTLETTAPAEATNHSDSSSTITTASSSSSTSSSSSASTTSSSSSSLESTESVISVAAEREQRQQNQRQLVRYVQRPLFCFDTT